MMSRVMRFSGGAKFHDERGEGKHERTKLPNPNPKIQTNFKFQAPNMK
jgi:hypothetical protein